MNLLRRFSKRHNQKRPDLLRQSKYLHYLARLKIPDHTTAKPLLHRRKQHRLRYNSDILLIPVQILINPLILTDHNKARRPFPRMRQNHLRQRPRPLRQSLHLLHFFRLPRQKILQRLLIYTRRTKPRTIHKPFQRLPRNPHRLIKTTITPVF